MPEPSWPDTRDPSSLNPPFEPAISPTAAAGGPRHPPATWSPHLMPAFVTKEAPDFTAEAVVHEEFKTIRLSDYRGKYVVLFFYPLDFTFVCPTEIIAFSDTAGEFQKRGVQVLGAYIDSKFSPLSWRKTSKKEGSLGDLN